MSFTFAAAALIATLQVQPGSIADQASRSLWIVAEDAATLAAIDRAPASNAPSGPVAVNFWLFMAEADGYDTLVSALTVDCPSRTFVHHSFTAYRGPAFVGATAAQDTSSQAVEPDTFLGAMLAHVCDPSPDGGRAADFENFQAAGAARATLPAG
jgi:hypothetical protein